MEKEIKLGVRIKDRVTGFEGIVTARVEYLNGCIQYCITPKMGEDKEAKMPAGEYVDVGQVTYVNEGILKPTKTVDGIMPNKPKY